MNSIIDDLKPSLGTLDYADRAMPSGIAEYCYFFTKCPQTTDCSHLNSSYICFIKFSYFFKKIRLMVIFPFDL